MSRTIFHFIKKTFAFCGILLLCIIVELASILFFARNITYDIGDKNILLLGDSHMECAVNDSIFRNSCNLAKAGDQLPSIYAKLKRFQYKEKDTVIIGIDLKKFSSHSNMHIYRNGGSRVLRYFPILSIDELTMYVWEKVDLKLLRMHKYIDGIVHHSFPKQWYGGYYRLDGNSLAQDSQKTGSSDLTGGYYGSEISEKYFDQIVSFCRTRGIKLYILLTPIYQSSLNADYAKFEQIMNKYNNELEVLDFTNTYLPDSCFRDVSHLNYRGADFFSEMMNDLFKLK